MQYSYESYLERLQKNVSSKGLDEVRLAREEFHRLTGEFSDGEPWFEVRMMMFLDWYLLDRPGCNGKTPVVQFLQENQDALTPEEKTRFKYLTVTLRSIFRLQSIKGQTVFLEDMIGGALWKARWTLPIVGLKPNDVLNTRIVLFNGVPTTGRSTVFHPKDAHEAIIKIIDRALSSRMPKREIVNHLDKMRLKLDRYSNVKIRHVYQYPDDAVF